VSLAASPLRTSDALVCYAAAAALAASRGLATSRTADLERLGAALTELDAALQPVRSGRSVVAVVGRTKAGKSTLRFVLSGEGEDRIGRGGLRTTRTTIDYAWRGLRLRDTPGVGAPDGHEDTALAAEAAATADLVLWLSTSEGVQQATVEPVRRLLSRGAPLLLVVNHKQLHDLHEDQSWDRDVLLTDREVRERRLREVLEGTVGAAVDVVHVQLDVARWARACPTRARAWEASGLPALERAIAEAAARAREQRAAVRRARQVTALRAVGVALDDLVAAVVGDLARNKSTLEEHRVRAALERRAWGNDRAAVGAGARELIASQLAAAERLALVTEHRGEANAAWRSALDALDAELTTSVTRSAGRALGAAGAGRVDDALVLDAPPVQRLRADLAGDPLNARAAGTGKNVLKVISAAPFWLLGPIGAAAGSVVAPLVTDVLTRNVGPTAEGERTKRATSVQRAHKRAESAFWTRLEALLKAADGLRYERVIRPTMLRSVALLARRMLLERQLADLIHAVHVVREALDED
jgi:hypothetical protein